MSYKGSIVIGRKAPCPFNTSQFSTGASFTVVSEALRVVLARAGVWYDTVALSIGSNTAVASTAFHYAINGTGYSKAAVSAGTALAAGTVTADKWGIWLFSINAAGTITCTAGAGNVAGYADEATAIAALPATPASEYAMGYVTVLTASGQAFIPGTDALQGGTGGNPATTTNYYTNANVNSYVLDDDYDPGRGSITGFHKASIDTTEAYLGGAPGDELIVLLGAGTVDSVSAVGKIIAQYTLAAATLEAGSINLASLASDVTARLLGTTAVTALNRAYGVAGTIGSTGNDTTHLHLDGLTYGNDEINGYLLVIYDDSEAEYHFRWITDWVLASELATVATLPFTPEDATDTYALLPIIKDADVAAILADTGTDGVPLTAAAVDAILDEVVAGSTTLRQALRGFMAVLLGKASGLATATAVYRDIADTMPVVTATVDADGNRSAVTLDLDDTP